MSPPFAEEPDPLLSFSSESAAARPITSVPEPAGQPVAAPVDPPPPSTPSVPIASLIARLDRLERALENSNARHSSLKAELATLVRVVGDIRTQASGRPVVATTRIAHRRRVSWTASAIVGALLGVAGAVFAWTYLSSDGDATIAASAQEPAPQPAPALVADPSLASVVPIAHEVPKAPALKAPALKAPEALRAPEAPKAPLFVGTLSIDADPGGDVFVDRQSAGHTPLRLTNLRAGSHLIWVERDGYRRFTRVVLVPSDRITRLSAELEPIASR